MLIHSHIHSCIHSPIHALVPICSSITIHSLIHHPSTHSPTQSLPHSLIYSLTHSLIHSLTHSFIRQSPSSEPRPPLVLTFPGAFLGTPHLRVILCSSLILPHFIQPHLNIISLPRMNPKSVHFCPCLLMPDPSPHFPKSPVHSLPAVILLLLTA